METINNILSNRGFQVAVGVSTAAAALALANHLHQRKKFWKARQAWNSQPEDVVILHQFPRGRTTISLSPFPVKVEAFLRMNGIKYVNDFEYPYSPDKHKSPWITVNGEDVSDSQLVLEFLAKKFGIESGHNQNPKDKAIARSMRILMEDHLYWVLMVERYVHHEARHLKDLVRRLHKNEKVHSLIFERYRQMAVKKMSIQTYCQGLGRHTKGDLQRMGIEDLTAISSFLGSKTYILGGDKPSELDAVLFGFVTFILNSSPDDSPFKTLVEKRLTNLVQHSKLIKSKCFPDWDKLIEEDPDVKEDRKPEVDKASDEKDSGKKPEETLSVPAPEKEVAKEEKKTASTAAASATTVTALPPVPEKVRTPMRKVSERVSPTRKLSSANIERAQTPSKKPAPINGHDKKENGDPDHPVKPRPTTLNPSPATKRSTTAPLKTSTPAKPTETAKNVTTPKTVSPTSPISPVGTTPKTSASASTANSSRKSSFSANSGNKAKQGPIL